MALRQLAIWAAMGATGATPVGVVAAAPGSYDVLGAYAQAAATAPCLVDARDLAAIQSVESPSAVVDETGMVSNPDGSPVRGDGGQSFGAFQFYTEAGTWTVYGNGGNPDRLPDAAAATARMLCANNYATDRHAAIARHNGSGPAAQAYADRVIAAADSAPPIAPGQSSAASSDCESGSGRSIGAVVGRAWCNLVVRPWLALGSRNPDNEAWDKVDHAVFGDAPSSSSTPATSARGDKIVRAANAWVGRDFNPGVPSQCDFFVRRALSDAGLHPGVTTQTLDGYSTGVGRANSWGADLGQVIRDPGQLQPGDVVMFANTIAGLVPGDISHVGIYAGGGMIIDRGTYANPVTRRPLATFDHFVAGVRLTPTGARS